MALKKSLSILVIITIVLLSGTCVVACETTDHAAIACHKQLAAQLIAEAQIAHKKAESSSGQLKVLIGLQSFGFSMWSMHRTITRRADVEVALLEINKLNRIKDSAVNAIMACTSWRNSTREDSPAGVRCHQTIEALRRLQK